MSKLTKTDAIMMAAKSATMRDLNPHLALDKIAAEEAPNIARKPGKKRREMNKTEGAFSIVLEARVKRGELLWFDYEAITLRWGPDGLRYTADFVALRETAACSAELVFFEIKGGHIWTQDMVKFKAARAEFTYFEFQMWQFSEREWRQLI